jgi:cytochrome c6
VKIIALLLTIFLLTMPIAPAASDPIGGVSGLATGAKVFEIHCAGCHAQGGNIVRRGKNLKLKALQKNQVDSLEAIATLVTQGKNNMSAYRDRLTSEQIQSVAEYVLNQAQIGWR